ncbi:hypothetical protein [Burkholderia gladioli]|uniref:hypothetical protein n=1 Tax=Burkholderia gladioli TaxID=28095 RepID=UPI000AF2DDE2|nr:hypothetical protein [Burkholderia gladioli]
MRGAVLAEVLVSGDASRDTRMQFPQASIELFHGTPLDEGPPPGCGDVANDNNGSSHRSREKIRQ